MPNETRVRVAKAIFQTRWPNDEWDRFKDDDHVREHFLREADAAIAALPVQVNGEPVAYGEFFGGKCVTVTLQPGRFNTVPLYASPPAPASQAVGADGAMVAQINALPQRLRDYIHHLETDCDPHGTLRENFRQAEENKGLRAECERLSAPASQVSLNTRDIWDSEMRELLSATDVGKGRAILKRIIDRITNKDAEHV